ncbi:MAG: IS607 family transposase [Planctomycetota bacterium]
MKLSEYAKKIGISYKIAWNHYKQGFIPGAYQLPTGTIIVPNEVFLPAKITPSSVAIYTRVSSHENKENLKAQVERLKNYASAKGFSIRYIVQEIGSGINDHRKKLQSLLQKEDWNILLVEHKDRLTRFGFNYLKILLEKENRFIEVVNWAEDEKGDLIEDLVSIIYSFAAQMYGIRRAKRKTETILQELKREE